MADEMDHRKYRVQGMTCGGCVNSVTRALKQAMPDVDVEVVLEAGEVTVAGAHEADVVQKAVEDAGFDYGGAVA